MLSSDRAADVEAVPSGQAEVEDQYIVAQYRLDQVTIAVRQVLDIVIQPSEAEHQGLCDGRVVLDEQDVCHQFPWIGVERGSATRKDVDARSLRTSIVPW